MATYNRTATGGGTAGHPANAAVPYVMTSPVWDTADGGTGGDVVQLIDVPADTMIVAGALEVLDQSVYDYGARALGVRPWFYVEDAAGVRGVQKILKRATHAKKTVLISCGISTGPVIARIWETSHMCPIQAPA